MLKTIARVFVVILILTHSIIAAEADDLKTETPDPVNEDGEEKSFLDEFPHLKNFLNRDETSQMYFGFGISPIGVLKNRIMFGVNIFQVHYIGTRLDWELLSGTFGIGVAQEDTKGSRHYSLRTIPKYRIFEKLSIGPVYGYEFVVFPDVKSRLSKNRFFTPTEPFSSKGHFLGITFSQTFNWEPFIFKFNEIIYKQTYSTSNTKSNWNYFYEETALQKDGDRKSIAPSTVFLVEMNVLF